MDCSVLTLHSVLRGYFFFLLFLLFFFFSEEYNQYHITFSNISLILHTQETLVQNACPHLPDKEKPNALHILEVCLPNNNNNNNNQ